MTIKIAFVYNSKGYKRDFTIIQRVHCDCKGYCTLHKKHRENADCYDRQVACLFVITMVIR